MASYLKHNTLPEQISGKHNIQRSYPFMNPLNFLENLYAVILPSASQGNTRRDFAAILKSKARSWSRVSTNQTSETKIACINLHALMSQAKNIRSQIYNLASVTPKNGPQKSRFSPVAASYVYLLNPQSVRFSRPNPPIREPIHPLNK